MFGGIEEGLWRCFIVLVEMRLEVEFLLVIKKWIEFGILIVFDCWKFYVNLEKNGYEYVMVNYFKEFVNNEGKYMNKIEG